MIIWKDYCISIDENSFTSYKRDVVKKGKTKGKEVLSLIGHYSYGNMDNLLRRIIHIETGKSIKGHVPIGEYVQTWRDVNEKLTKDLEHMFKPFK